MLALDETSRRDILCGESHNMGITSISEIHKSKDIEEPKVSSMEAFLDSFSKKGTRN